MTTTATQPQPDILLLTAAAPVTPGNESKPARVEIVCYAGGIIRVNGYPAVLIDLAGLERNGVLPLLDGHNNSLGSLIGQGQAEVRGAKLIVVGTITRTTPAGQQVLALAADGIQLSASVGIEPGKIEHVRAGQTVQANRRRFTAPPGGLAVVRKSQLREVSLLPVGADPDTRVQIAARGRGQENHMPEQQTESVEEIRAAEAAETTRIEVVRKVCGGKHAEIEAKAIGEGWDLTKTELEVLRAERPKAPRPYSQDIDVADRDILAAAVLMRAGQSGVAEKSYPAPVLEAAHGRYLHMMDMVEGCLRADGIERPMGREQMIRAALSTYSLPTALGDSAAKLLLDAYQTAPGAWRAWCKIVPVANFHQHNVVRPTHLGGMKEVGPGGELEHGTISEALSNVKADTFGKLLSIDRRDVINDDLGIFTTAAEALGREAARGLSDLVITVLLTNAGDFFHADNANYLTGGGSVLCVSGLSAAIALLRAQVDKDGRDLDLVPKTLVVPPALEPTGRMLLASEFTGEVEGEPSGNPVRNAADLAIESRLSNVKFTGYSAAAWYLFAAPEDAPMVVAFLNGQESPIIESMGLDAQVDRLAYHWRVYHDYGAALCDPKAAVRNDGE